MPTSLSVVVLAAGKGTRMRNGIPKVLHPLAGKPLIWHVLRLAQALGAARIVTVLAPGMADIVAAVEASAPGTLIALQDPPQGTGHAVMAASTHLPQAGCVLVLFGDTPLLSAATAGQLVSAVLEKGATIAVLGMRPSDSSGYGRLQVAAGELVAIVEERHADAELKRTGLCNAGAMAFDAARLPDLMAALPFREDRGEFYLTDAVQLAVARGWPCLAVEGPWQDGVGINSQAQLAEAERLFQARRRAAMLADGVILQAPETVFFAADTELAPGVLVEPFVVFGPGVMVAGPATIHSFSHLEGAELAANTSVGPFARLRPGSELAVGAKVGNFVELKNAALGAGAKASHLSYVGDATIGTAANLGAGTITCNYDGFAKHRTLVGARAFIGSNSALVAPVTIGDDAIIAAGSTITQDVPSQALAVGRARQTTLLDRARALRDRWRRRGT